MLLLRKLSNRLRNIYIYRLYKDRKDRALYKKRLPYLEEIKEVISSETSIISSNCLAGRFMQDLDMVYNSPTLGLYFFYPDYIEFLQHLEFYLKEAKIQFVEHSKYKIGDERRSKWKHWYPIGLLDGKVEIHFLHYYSEEEAAGKWYRRAARVNMSKLVIIGADQNLCSTADMLNFDKLPYERKIFFSSRPINGKSIIYMKEFDGQGQVGDPYKQGDLFYRYFAEYTKSWK